MASVRNEGRNEIRVNNSDGRCLLENWVEERAVDGLDPIRAEGEEISSAELYKDGHKGLITTDFCSGVANLTTVRDSYRPPQHPGIRTKGVKQELLERALYEQVSKQVDDEFNKPPTPEPLASCYNLDYDIPGFQPTELAPTAAHDYTTEQPATFWTEHVDKIHGRSEVKKTFDTPFRKNSSFSKPIYECYDQPKPYELEKVPNM